MTVPATNKRSHRPPTAVKKSAPGVLQAMHGLRPEQVAFLGEYRTTAADKRIDVQILCWPTVPTAWSMLAHALGALQSLRQASHPATQRASVETTWIQQVAPQLCLPVDREPTAIESTLATLIRRLPLRFAVAVIEQQGTQNAGPDPVRYRSLFAGCLTAYDAYLKSTKQAACRVIIAAPGDAASDDVRRATYGDALARLDSTARLGTLELSDWPEAAVPLPMEVAQLAAAAVGHHVQHPSIASPLFETVRVHLVPPSRFHAPSLQKRRK